VFNQNEPPYDEIKQELSQGNYPWKYSREEKDVNGDSLPEIIVQGEIMYSNFKFFTILGYDEGTGKWHELFDTAKGGHFCVDFLLKADDDHLNLDSFVCHGGSGISGLTWERTWLKCNNDTCWSLWVGTLYDSTQVFGTTGSGVNNDFSITAFQRTSPDSFELTTRRFEIVHISYLDYPLIAAKRIVHPEIREVYRWNGSEFALAERYQTSQGFEVTREFDQATDETNKYVNNILCEPCWIPTGVGHEYNYSKLVIGRSLFWGMPAPGTDDPHWESEKFSLVAASRDSTGQFIAGAVAAKDQAICRLTVQQLESGQFNLIGRLEIFCTPNFTHIYWIDVDGDGKDELLFLTIPPGDEFGGDNQQLRIYRVDKALTQIAQMKGYVNGADGAGIKWNRSQNDFLLFAGVSLEEIAKSCDGVLACIENRRFQTHRWDKTSNSFQPVK